jgi:hypothetical protein
MFFFLGRGLGVLAGLVPWIPSALPGLPGCWAMAREAMQ